MTAIPPKTDFVLMGISLSNKTFTRQRMGAIFDWCDRQSPFDFLVWLGDDLEAINFEVFKGMAPSGALSRARSRGRELQAMVMKAYRETPSRRVRLARVATHRDMITDPDYGAAIARAHGTLDSLFRDHPPFREDVLRQVAVNLGSGNKATETRDEALLTRLADYILGELSVFMGVYKSRGTLVEVYPGPNLFVKENLIRGDYGHTEIFQADGEYLYIDLSCEASLHIRP
ncbi:MAG: tRNA-dependent cyclodipeptide synthase [Alphaproteobacteria bacterium]